MRIEPRQIAVLAALGVTVGIVTYKVCSYIEKDRDDAVEDGGSKWDIYKETRKNKKDQYVTIDDERSMHISTRGGNAIIDERELDVIPLKYKSVPDNKPDISSALANALERSSERYHESLENEETNIVEQEGRGDEKEEDDMDDPSYGVARIEFDDDGLPIFSEEDFDSEDGNITMITQGEYLNSFQNYDKEQAVWFEKSQVLVNTSLNPVDVVDTVGPTAFLTLMKDKSKSIFVKNKEMETDYELFVNDSTVIEDAWEEQGVM